MLLPKAVLEEDAYVEALGAIIERDFFPDLERLKQQKSILDGEVARDSHLTATTLRAPGSASVRSIASGWDQPTPSRSGAEDEDEAERTAIAERSGNVDSDSVPADQMTLNQFVATHTSEDNEAFNELQEKTVEDHRRKYHWAYDANPERGDSKLHLLQDGTWISKERRLLADAACKLKGPKDDRPTAPETWKHRARNPLLFPPEIETTRAICGVSASSNEKLLLENGSGNKRLGRPPRAPKTTVYANSRFNAVVPTESERVARYDETESSTSSVRSTGEFGLVQMTPLIAPGVDASPLMTWGDIEGTPMIIGAHSTPEHVLHGPAFELKESSAREKVADRLEAQARKRKTSSSRRQVSSTPRIGSSLRSPMTSSSRKRPGTEIRTPIQNRSVRSRLSSLRSPFGSDPQLRASYSTPLLPPRNSSVQKTPKRH